MLNKLILLIISLILPSVLLAKTFIGITTPLSSKMKYSDSTGSAADLAPGTGLNMGVDIMFGDRERGSITRHGIEAQKISLTGQQSSTSYSLDSREYLYKFALALSPSAEREGSFGFNPSLFLGVGVLEYQFKKLNEGGRESEKTKETDTFNYTPYGFELPVSLYFRSFYIGASYRSYLNEIKIKYLPNPDGSESTGTFKNYTGWFFNVGVIF